jgi:hypothetical protein
MISTIFNHIKNVLKMAPNSLEIILFSQGSPKQKTIVEWLAKSLPPIIVKQEDDTKKLILKTLTDTPAIYMS